MVNEFCVVGSCWVYILERDDCLINIGVTGNLWQRLKAFRARDNEVPNQRISKLVYYRQFSDTLTALGFKLLLHQLSPDSVDRLIRDMNFTKQDLTCNISQYNN